jgi:hypothetical protein
MLVGQCGNSTVRLTPCCMSVSRYKFQLPDPAVPKREIEAECRRLEAKAQ